MNEQIERNHFEINQAAQCLAAGELVKQPEENLHDKT
jgi:hypothetical protein